jgi:hypothetical protein
MSESGITEKHAAILERMLSEDFYLSPLRFAMWAYGWGEGDLKSFSGPRKWQREVMLDMESYLKDGLKQKKAGLPFNDFYKHAIASGRGPGKSALVGMLAHWFISTRIGGSVWVAANGEPQLRTKTFPEISKWVARGINSEFFDTNAMSIQPATWFRNYIESEAGLGRSTRYYYTSGQLWSEETPDAFAGAHNFDGEMAIFDEAAGIPSAIWTVQEGVFTEDIVDRFWLAFSNPRSTEGAFFECFHKDRKFWRTTQLDSRTVEGVSQATYSNIIEKYGEDSDEARVEVYGQFPKSSQDQFISPALVDEAIAREKQDDDSAPIVIGVDPARGGMDSTVILVRKGRNVLSIKRYSGEDLMMICGRVIDAIDEWKPDLTVIDEGGLGAGVLDRLVEQRYRVRGVNFGWKASNPVMYGNKRAEMWGSMKDWLKKGHIPDDKDLKQDLVGPRKEPNSSGTIFLETKKKMKARGLASPDAADALAVTFAYPIANREIDKLRKERASFRGNGYSYAQSGSWMS